MVWRIWIRWTFVRDSVHLMESNLGEAGEHESMDFMFLYIFFLDHYLLIMDFRLYTTTKRSLNKIVFWLRSIIQFLLFSIVCVWLRFTCFWEYVCYGCERLNIWYILCKFNRMALSSSRLQMICCGWLVHKKCFSFLRWFIRNFLFPSELSLSLLLARTLLRWIATLICWIFISIFGCSWN